MPEPEGGPVVSNFWNWKKRAPAEKKRGVDAQTLADIARGMQHAVNSTQELTEQHYARIVERYFNEDGTAITKRITLPHNAGEMEVPVIALMPPSGLMLKEAEVEMSVRIDATAVKSAAPTDEETEHTRTSFAVSLGPRSHDRPPSEGGTKGGASSIDIKMKFVAGDPPEGIARIIEAFANTMIPHEMGKLPPDPQAPPQIVRDGPASPPPDDGAPDIDKPAVEPPGDDGSPPSF